MKFESILKPCKDVLAPIRYTGRMELTGIINSMHSDDIISDITTVLDGNNLNCRFLIGGDFNLKPNTNELTELGKALGGYGNSLT